MARRCGREVWPQNKRQRDREMAAETQRKIAKLFQKPATRAAETREGRQPNDKQNLRGQSFVLPKHARVGKQMTATPVAARQTRRPRRPTAGSCQKPAAATGGGGGDSRPQATGQKPWKRSKIQQNISEARVSCCRSTHVSTTNLQKKSEAGISCCRSTQGWENKRRRHW